MLRWNLSLRAAATRALDVLGPRTCAACEVELTDRGALCEACAGACAGPSCRMLPSGITVVAASRYAGPLTEAIQRLKYRDRADLGIPLGAWASGRVAALLAPDCVVIPVPLHARRLAERGYNQAALLARGFAPTLGAQAITGWLRRSSDTAAQATLTAAARRENVRSAFRASRKAAGHRVWLIDDVVTTGATAVACAESLRSAGADVRGVACVAVAERDERGDGGAQLI